MGFTNFFPSLIVLTGLDTTLLSKSLSLSSSMRFHAPSRFLLGMVGALLPMAFDNLDLILYSHKDIF